jgi:predicted transcriptional regulator
MDKAQHEQLLHWLKALADENRLTLIGLLAQREYNVGELAERLELAEPTISHHLSKLRLAGLVHLRADGTQRLYRVNPTALAKFKQRVQEVEVLPPAETPQSDNAWIEALDLPEEDRQILRDYTVNGRLSRLPGKQKKLLVILRWLATKFEPGRTYTEAEVNAVIKTAHDDYAGLRRDLVDMGFLRRERGGGKYWLTPDDEAV